MPRPPADDSFGSIPISTAENPLPPEASEPAPPEPPPASRRRILPGRGSNRWLKKLALLGGSGLIVYGLAGFFLIPLLLTTIVPERLGRQLERPVTVGGAAFNPFTLTLSLRNTIVGPKLTNPEDPVDPLLSFSELLVDFEAASIVKRGIVCRKIHADRLFLHLVREKDRSYNLFKAWPAAAQGGKHRFPPFSFSLMNITLTGSRLRFDDSLNDKTHTVDKIELALPALSNLSYQIDCFIEPRFSAEINGSPAQVAAQTTITDELFQAELDLRLTALDLPGYLAYLPASLPVTVTKGQGDLELKLVFSSGPAADPLLQIKGTARFTDLALQDGSGAPLAAVPTARVAGSIAPLTGSYFFEEITAHKPELHLKRSRQGQWNFGMNQPRQNADAAGAETSPTQTVVRIDHLMVDEGILSLADQRSAATALNDTWSDIRLALDNFSSAADTPAAFAMSGKNLDSSRLSCQGKLVPAKGTAKGFIVADHLALPRFSPYLLESSGLKLTSGLAVKLKSGFQATRHRRNGKFAVSFNDISMSLQNLALKNNKTKVLQLRKATLEQASLHTRNQALNLGKMEVTGGHIFLAWDKENVLNWSGFQAPANRGGPKTASNRTAFFKDVGLESFTVAESAISIEHQAYSPALRLEINDLALQAENISGSNKRLGRITASGKVAPEGRLHVAGPLSLSPFKTTLGYRVDNLALKVVAPLVNSRFRPTLAGGSMHSAGTLEYPGFSLQGNAAIRDFAAAGKDGNVVIGWQNAATQTLAMSISPALSLNLGAVTLERPFLRWAKTPSGKSLLAGLFAAAPSAPQEQGGKPRLAIREIKVGDGQLHFADRTVSPAYAATVASISGTVENLQTRPGNRVRYSLDGLAQEDAPMALNGTIGLFDKHLFVDFKGRVSNLDISPLSPYATPHLGYHVSRGRLDLASSYHHENRHITADNHLDLTRFKLGKPVAGETHLPLTMALLKDKDGHINFDLPVTGSTADPSFSFRSSLVKVVRNLLLKTAVTPFSLVSAILPGKKPVDSIIFNYGKADLTGESKQHLENMAKVLQARPWLTLSIKGLADARGDRKALAANPPQGADRKKDDEQKRIYEELANVYGKEEILPPDFTPAKPGAAQPAPKGPPASDAEGAKLATLADQRAKAAYLFLTGKLRINPERVRVAPEGKSLVAGSQGKTGNRVDFKLGFLRAGL